jgi:hypothetical protein
VQRAHRAGVFERGISLLSIYPFRCQICLHRFRARRPGVRYAKRSDDRREFVRYQVRLPVTLSFQSSRASGHISEISVAGGTIDTSLRAPAGARVQVDIQLPNGHEITVSNALVRSVRGGSLGVYFTSLSAAEQTRLQEFILSVAGHRQPSFDAAGRGDSDRGPFASVALVVLVVAILCAVVYFFPRFSLCVWGVSC